MAHFDKHGQKLYSCHYLIIESLRRLFCMIVVPRIKCNRTWPNTIGKQQCFLPYVFLVEMRQVSPTFYLLGSLETVQERFVRVGHETYIFLKLKYFQ